MSIFAGPLREYPCISIDNFTAETHNCTAFFLSHCHRDHMKGLDSKSFLELLRMSNDKIFLFCSEMTKNLMMYDDALKQLINYTKAIPINQPTLLSTYDKALSIDCTLTITLIPAGHCVGSVMFLFEGRDSTVLYTGDFRYEKDEIRKVECLKTPNGVKNITALYIDSTFLTPSFPQLPPRDKSRREIVRLIRSWLKGSENRGVFIQCAATYGYEFILKNVAIEFNTKIHVTQRKYDLYSCVPGIREFVTCNSSATKIHSCFWNACQEIRWKKSDMIIIKPSTIWFYHKIQDKPLYDISSYDDKCGIYRVLHSMHSSYNEIVDVVSYLQPEHIHPTVVPVDAIDITTAYDRLQCLLSNKVGDRLLNLADHSPNTSATSWNTNVSPKLMFSPSEESIAPNKLGLDESPIMPLSSVRRRKARDRDKVYTAPKFEDRRIMNETMEISKKLDIEKTIGPLTIENSSIEASSKVANAASQRLISPASNLCANEQDIDNSEFDIAGSPDITEPLGITLAKYFNELHSIDH